MGVVVPSMSRRTTLVFSGTTIAAIFINGKRYICVLKACVWFDYIRREAQILTNESTTLACKASGELTHGAAAGCQIMRISSPPSVISDSVIKA